MRYKLAFSCSESGLFRVTALPIGIAAQLTTALYEDKQAFIRQLEQARLGRKEYMLLISASLVATSSPGMPTCCEEITLDAQQLNVLKLNAKSQRAAP
jgi:hypothetical protein